MNRKFFTLIIALCIGASSFAQLSGTYYIPAGTPNYSTLQAAIADLNTLGINGNVTFIVADDYTETAPAGGYLLGSTLLNANSVTYTLTLQRSGTGTNPPVFSAWAGTTTNLDAIWKIAGTDNVTINGIDLTEVAANANQTQRMEFGYAMVKLNNVAPIDGCQNIVIKNCTITLNKYLTATTFTTCTGIYSGNHIATALTALTLTAATDVLGNSKIFNNNITNVTTGVYFAGWNGASPPFGLYDQSAEIGVSGANSITNFNTYGIRVTNHKNLKVANNNLNSVTLPASGMIGIYVQNTAGGDAYNNTVTIQPTGSNNQITGMSINGALDLAYTSNIYNNTVQNCTHATATSAAFVGISNSGAGTVNFYNNTVTNNTIPGSGGFTGLDSGFPTSLNMFSNTVTNNTKTGTSGTFNCLRGSGSGNIYVYDNLIHSNYNSMAAVGNQGGTINGIVAQNAALGHYYKNKIYNLSTNGSSTSAIVNGINVGSGTNMNIYNNFVSDLRAPATSGTLSNYVNSIAGINVSGGTNVNVIYNTVYLAAASAGTYFTTSALYVSSLTPILDLRNNVLVNVSTINFENYTGYVLAYRRNGAGLATYSNNSNANVFYVNEEETDFTCGTFWNSDLLGFPITFTEFQTLVGPSRDAGSFRELPPFVDVINTPYDLRMQTTIATNCESGGVQITSPIVINDDYFGTTRSLLPDIGAHEFTGIPAATVLNPGAVSTTLISSSQIDVAFAPNPSNNNVVIVWNTTGAFTTPAGTPPSNVNDPFAGGYLLYNGTSSPVNHTGLTGATTYYYKLFSYNGSDYSLGVAASTTTNIAPPSSFTATTISATQIDLAWTKNAFNSDVIIATNSTNTFGQPANGTAYSANDLLPTAGTVIYVGPLSAFNHTGLTPNQVTYYYKAWSYDPTNNNIYSPSGVTANATTFCSAAPIPYAEGFEYGGGLGCGTILDGNNNFDTWQIYSNYQSHSGSYCLRIFQAASDDWYFSNGLDLIAGTTYEVKFWYRNNSAIGNTHQFEVKWGNAGNPAAQTNTIYNNGNLTATTTWIQITCSSFTPVTSGIYFIGWHDYSAILPGHQLWIDDLEVTVTNIPASITWTGAANVDWFNSGNWNPTGVPGASTDVTIPGGLTNYPTINTAAVCNNITIGSGASLLDNGNLTVSGTATVNRNYTGGEWHLISSPISNATANTFLDLYLQKHTESTNAYTDISNPTTPLNVMQGYALWNDLAGIASFVGTLNTGNIGAANNITRSGQGWNLVGNPYPSAIDWDAAAGWTKTNVDNATYRHVNSAIWASYVGGVGVNGGSRYIPSCQGFFVGVTNGFTLGTLNMTNAVRTHSTSTFFKDEVSDIVRLEVIGNGHTDETVIRVLETATSDFDGQWDAHKLFGSVDDAPAIYSVDNDMMAINSLPATNTVPVGVKAGVPGEFTITATETSEFADVILEDLLTGAITDLKNNAYTFSYDMNMDNRFILHFTPLAVGENPEDLINIYSNQKDVYVSVPANTKGDIVVYNLMGQEVARTIISGVSNKITLDKSAYYVIKVVSDVSVVTEKVFVK